MGMQIRKIFLFNFFLSFFLLSIALDFLPSQFIQPPTMLYNCYYLIDEKKKIYIKIYFSYYICTSLSYVYKKIKKIFNFFFVCNFFQFNLCFRKKNKYIME